MNRLKVISDGSLGGVQVLTSDGKEIKGVGRVSFEASAPDEFPTVHIEILAQVSLEGWGCAYIQHPVSGEVKEVRRIVFADGEEVDLATSSRE